MPRDRPRRSRVRRIRHRSPETPRQPGGPVRDPRIETERNPSCLACGAAGGLLFEDLDDALFGVAGRWTLRKCPSAACGLVWLDPRPTRGDVAKAYETYYTHGPSRVSPLKAAARGLYRCAFEGFLPWLAGASAERRRVDLMDLASAKPGRLLDVGCGDGARLAAFRALGWTVAGQDVDPAGVQVARARGLDVHLGPLAEAPFPPAAFDAVVSSHVIEHVHDPAGLLRDAAKFLKPGGALVVVTPNAAGYSLKRFGRNWLGLDPPRHLHLFTPAALESIAKSAGFADAKVGTSPAHAQSSYGMSRGIELKRSGGRRQKLREEFRAIGFQREAQREHSKDPSCGDELVLRATR